MKPKLSTICIQSEAQRHSFLLFATKPYPKCSFTERLYIPTEMNWKRWYLGAEANRIRNTHPSSPELAFYERRKEIPIFTTLLTWALRRKSLWGGVGSYCNYGVASSPQISSPPPRLSKSTLALWMLTSVECPAWLLLTLNTGKSYAQCSQVQAKSWWTTLEFFFLLIGKVGLAFIMKPYRCFWKVSTALILTPSNMGLSSETQVAQWETATCLPWREPGEGSGLGPILSQIHNHPMWSSMEMENRYWEWQ